MQQKGEHTIVATKSISEAIKVINKTVRQNSFSAIVGSTGLGKTTALEVGVGRLAEHENRYDVIEATAWTRNSNLTASLMATMVRKLSSESPCRDIFARAIQLTRILKERKRAGRQIVLSVDECQDLSLDTMYGLKKMHELGREGTPLFSILMFGQPSMLKFADLKELRWRIAVHEMEGISLSETSELLQAFGVTVKSDRALNRIYQHSGSTPMGVQYISKIITKLSGDEEVVATEEMVNKAISGDLKNQVRSYGIANGEIARTIFEKTGKQIDASTVSKALSGTLAGMTADMIRAETASMIRSKQQVAV